MTYPGTKQLVIRVTPAMYAELKTLAQEEDRTVSQQVRLILRKALITNKEIRP